MLTVTQFLIIFFKKRKIKNFYYKKVLDFLIANTELKKFSRYELDEIIVLLLQKEKTFEFA